MPYVETDLSAIGKLLSLDVINNNGLLLLKKESIVTHVDIGLLQGHKIKEFNVNHQADLSCLGPPQERNAAVHKHLHVQTSHFRETAPRYTCAMKQTKKLFSKITETYIPSLQEFTTAFFPLLDQVLKPTGAPYPIYLVEGSDEYTYRHSINVGILAALIGKLMNGTREEIIRMGQSGLLHDAGKMLIPQEILMKPDRLTPDEYEVMKMHTIYGYNLLQHMEGVNETILQCTLLHHERKDGSGYPEGRSGGQIPMECQILAVADIFDAICSDRVYKKRSSPFEAAKILWELACRGHLHAEVVTRFIHYISMLYVGCRAILNSGEEVEVILIHEDEPLRPLVRRGFDYMDLRTERTLYIDQMIG